MGIRQRVSAASTHFPNTEKVKVEDSEFETLNHQEAEMLIDPEDKTSGSTHSQETPKLKSVKASITDEEIKGPENTHIPNGEDPAAGYLEKEAGMPVAEVPASAGFASMFDDEGDDEFEKEYSAEEEAEEQNADAEFDDLAGEDIVADAEFENFEAPEAEIHEDEETEVEETADFESDDSDEDSCVAVLDVDEVPEEDESELQFATIANSVHVIRSNRIIASMGPRTAAKAGVSDIYLSSQYQDVVASTIDAKGLRKGLIQAGFVLAKVKVTNSKVTARVVKAKVEAGVKNKVAALAAKDEALQQCLAIAAVGINRQFFKDSKNELKANLESELVNAGVRGGARIVRAMFAQYGVSYARSILTLANKLAEMPEVVRNQYAEALDMTSEGDFEPEEEIESDVDMEEDMEDFDPVSVSAALHNPIRKDVGALLAGVKTTAALDILNGSKPLV